MIYKNKYNLSNLENSYSGPCMVIGHGYSLDNIDFEDPKYKFVPKILINFYIDLSNVMGSTVWDKDIHKDVYTRMQKKAWKPWIFSSACETEQPYDYFLPDNMFPVKDGNGAKVFSGPRAVYLAQYMGFDSIYLAGFDFVPNKTDTTLFVRHKEAEHYKANSSDIYNNLKVQMNNFNEVIWKHDNIYNMNPESKLKTFPVGDLND